MTYFLFISLFFGFTAFAASDVNIVSSGKDLTEAQIRALEREADIHCRRLAWGDKLRDKGWTDDQIHESAPQAR